MVTKVLDSNQPSVPLPGVQKCLLITCSKLRLITKADSSQSAQDAFMVAWEISTLNLVLIAKWFIGMLEFSPQVDMALERRSESGAR